MRDLLERLLRSADVPTAEHAQLRWREYRAGADSTDPVARAAADAAFATLLAWYGGGLYRHIWGFVRSDAAEDVFQEVLRKLHQSRGSPRLADFHANVLPWLRRVAIRQCVDAHRRGKRRRERETRAARPEGEESHGGRAELQELIAAALGRLPEEQREAVALHYFEGLDRQTAAAALGIDRDTFSARLNAALERLRRLVPVPAAVVLGGTIDLPAALATSPPPLAAGRLGDLAARAWAAASPGAVRRTVTLALLGVVVAGGTAAGWALTRDPQPSVAERPDAAAPVAQLSVPNIPPRPPESLKEKNERLARDELVEPLQELIQKFYPGNPVHLTGLRQVGSELEVVFAPERPPPAFTGQAARLRGRFCTFRRRLVIHGQPAGETRWYWMNPEKPFVLPVRTLFGGEVVRGREDFAKARELFDRVLPRDPRSEAELIRFQFGETDELLLPVFPQGFTGLDGGELLGIVNDGLFIRDAGGRWRFAGECPGWSPVVAGGRIYCTDDGVIRSRPRADPTAPFEKWCDLPPTRKGEGIDTLFVAGGRLRVTLDPFAHYARPAGREGDWVRDPMPLPAHGYVEAGGMLFGYEGDELRARPADDPGAAWAKAGSWPPDCNMLVAVGDRLLAFPNWKASPIYSRPVKADPTDQWDVAGRVRDPYAE